MKKGLIILACLFVGISCTPADGTHDNDKGNGGGQTDGLTSYLEIYDHIDDYSYFTYPQTKRVPKKHWVCTDVENRSDRNSLGLSESNRLLLTLDVGYLLTAAAPDPGHGVAPLSCHS